MTTSEKEKGEPSVPSASDTKKDAQKNGTGLIKPDRKDIVPIEEDTLFELYRKPERRKRHAIYIGVTVTTGAVITFLAKVTGIFIPEIIGVPALMVGALLAWKATKPIVRSQLFLQTTPDTPVNWKSQNDAQIVAYATRRLNDLSFLDRERGWREIYAELRSIPIQLPALIRHWRSVMRDAERENNKLKPYREKPGFKEAHDAVKKAIVAAQENAAKTEEIIDDLLTSFDVLESDYTAAKHTGGGKDAVAIARHSIQNIRTRANDILQATQTAEDMTNGTEADELTKFGQALDASKSNGTQPSIIVDKDLDKKND